MSGLVAVALAVLAGASAATQSAINAAVGKLAGTLGAALVSFMAGLVVVLLAVLGFDRASLAKIATVPPGYYIGGFLGVVVVMSMTVAVTRVGLATASTGLVVGQLVTALLVDHFGLLGVQRIPLTPVRLAGVTLLIVALRLVFR